jgi:hypothetical protein
MKRILSIDGGGALGIIPLTVLKRIEEHMRKPIFELFDLITGSSIGAAIGGAVSSGKITCDQLHSSMVSDFQNIFKKRLRWPIFQPKYRKHDVRISLESHLTGMLMNQCKTKFFCTSINYIDGRTHFFKSWEDKDGKLDLTSAILRSVSAPLYFGKTINETDHEVWIDGGCGDMNDPSMQAYIEALRQNWLPNEKVHLLSLGCGQTFKGIPYNKSSKFNNIQEVAYYLNINDGGLGRAQTAITHDIWLKSFAEENPNFSYQRIQEYAFPKKISKLDAVKYIPKFIEYGEKLAKEVNYTYLWGSDAL